LVKEEVIAQSDEGFKCAAGNTVKLAESSGIPVSVTKCSAGSR